MAATLVMEMVAKMHIEYQTTKNVERSRYPQTKKPSQSHLRTIFKSPEDYLQILLSTSASDYGDVDNTSGHQVARFGFVALSGPRSLGRRVPI